MIATSACVGPATKVEDVAVRFAGVGSTTVDVTVIVLEIFVPGATAGGGVGGGVPDTSTTTGKLNDCPTAIAGLPLMYVHVIVPVAPTAGVTQFHSAGFGFVNETKIVFAGIVSVTCTLVDAATVLGPLLVSFCVKVILL